MLLACRHYLSEFHEWMENDSILRNLVLPTNAKTLLSVVN